MSSQNELPEASRNTSSPVLPDARQPWEWPDFARLPVEETETSSVSYRFNDGPATYS